ncbi:hypothetical protein CLOM_g13235 [Closterium sp. NIES-68]|nr:hypothetical protein CLOM_g13235 [Closterium sp. NIES-68]GJP67120.1 hypothetical protein CLOP_g23983 [Closterium sp. NIES-67]
MPCTLTTAVYVHCRCWEGGGSTPTFAHAPPLWLCRDGTHVGGWEERCGVRQGRVIGWAQLFEATWQQQAKSAAEPVAESGAVAAAVHPAARESIWVGSAVQGKPLSSLLQHLLVHFLV